MRETDISFFKKSQNKYLVTIIVSVIKKTMVLWRVNDRESDPAWVIRGEGMFELQSKEQGGVIR